ncbi:MAG: helix-turn-helix transcriptional regulator [Chloroflexi bacterium]|nr:helix-turn-helix transcriptional regulator [Chloroflexota bacterium]
MAKVTPKRLRRFRQRLLMTQTELGTLLGLTQRQIARLEAGDTPISRLHELALMQIARQEDKEL